MRPAGGGSDVEAPHPFAAELTERRRHRLAAVLKADFEGAALIATDPLNIRYLSGFDGSNGALLVRSAGAVLVTDSRYVEQAREQAPGVEVRQGRDVLCDGLRLVGDQRVCLEGDHLSANRWSQLGADPRLIMSRQIVERLREVKDQAELAALDAACRISESALTQILGQGVLGRSERAVARQLEWLLGEGVGQGPGFESIVATGPNSAIPHHQPTDRMIERGDLLKIDFGAKVSGYHADITRTFVVGAEPADWQRDLHALVAEAHAAARARTRSGVSVGEVDEAARGLIADAGHAEHFGHGLGHGVGLAIHERPLLGPGGSGTLTAGMAVTIEPGCYLPGLGGVRIEDTLVIEDPVVDDETSVIDGTALDDHHEPIAGDVRAAGQGYRSLVTLTHELAVVH